MLAYEVPPPNNVFNLSVVRLGGKTGRLVVYWEAAPITADPNDFSPLSGNVTFQDGQVKKASHKIRMFKCFGAEMASILCLLMSVERNLYIHHYLG